MASGHKGTLRVRIQARGKAAHSAYPEAGDSAIHRLLATISHLQSLDWGTSDVLGSATLNVGVISGGVAGNVLAPSAEATLYWRLVGEAEPARRRLEAILAADDNLSYEHVGQNDAVHLPDAARVPSGPDVVFHRHSRSCPRGGRRSSSARAASTMPTRLTNTC